MAKRSLLHLNWQHGLIEVGRELLKLDDNGYGSNNYYITFMDELGTRTQSNLWLSDVETKLNNIMLDDELEEPSVLDAIDFLYQTDKESDGDNFLIQFRKPLSVGDNLKREVIAYFKGFEEGDNYTITIDFVSMVDAMISLLEDNK